MCNTQGLNIINISCQYFLHIHVRFISSKISILWNRHKSYKETALQGFLNLEGLLSIYFSLLHNVQKDLLMNNSKTDPL